MSEPVRPRSPRDRTRVDHGNPYCTSTPSTSVTKHDGLIVSRLSLGRSRVLTRDEHDRGVGSPCWPARVAPFNSHFAEASIGKHQEHLLSPVQILVKKAMFFPNDLAVAAKDRAHLKCSPLPDRIEVDCPVDELDLLIIGRQASIALRRPLPRKL